MMHAYAYLHWRTHGMRYALNISAFIDGKYQHAGAGRRVGGVKVP